MNPFIPSMLVICIYLAGSDSVGLEGKSVIFPTATANSYVRLYSSPFSSLTAFTICFWAASEAARDYSLFSYATSRSYNELLIWQTSSGGVSLYLNYFVVEFSLPKMDALLRHICITWESSGGSATAWVNGQRSLQKFGGKGRVVKGSGQFIIGQEQDSVGGGFSKSQSFVGEMSDVNMWDYVLTPGEINIVSRRCSRAGGNIINWETAKYVSGGITKIEDNNNCTF
ncbi:C-reactive protein-like isoform X2 [Pristis pectinata]|uniref:C-reactive protein-like isoform X2 n=1 Tax=Pristis pectinata TaxID=685728 RepID=UPI00223E5F20|nr:C-reactive protein-like isoform X2 [Pristis pectinata]